LIALLPTPRPRKKIPIKQAIFLIAKAEQQLLLEKRPNSGIWGGLWCFPQFESIDAALAWCHNQAISISNQHLSAQDRHLFTHFELHYRALVIRAKPAENFIKTAGNWYWHDLQNMTKLAFPTPINRLIEHTNIQELYND
jgi:A/G-specific adenine glycosylase